MVKEKEDVQNQVYETRSALGITQEDLAGHVGVSRQTIIAVEKGNYVPSVLLALKIAQFFKKPVEEIFIIKKI
jgi:putative transcriptional regulator